MYFCLESRAIRASTLIMNYGNDSSVEWIRKLCWSLSQGFLEMGRLERFVHILFEVGLGLVAEELKARPAEGRGAAPGEGGPLVKEGTSELALKTGAHG